MLQDSAGKTLDDVNYGAGFPWPTIGEWGIIVGILTSAVVLSTAFKNR